MPKLIPQEQFEELTVLAAQLLDRAREIAAEQGIAPAGAGEELQVLTTEAQALDLAILGLTQASPLSAREMFVAIGGALGVVLAQQTDSHAGLLDAHRSQMRASYDEIVEASMPKGNA